VSKRSAWNIRLGQKGYSTAPPALTSQAPVLARNSTPKMTSTTDAGLEWNGRTEVLLPTQAGTRHQERAQSSNGKIATVVLIFSDFRLMRLPTVRLGSRACVLPRDESMISELDASITPRSGRDGSASQIAAQIAAVSNKRGT
jgi:hypothetical protein